MNELSRKAVCVLLVLGQLSLPGLVLSAPVVTGPIDIDDQPINTSSTVKPNVMFTLDNSGSMDSTFAPENAASQRTNHCYLDYQVNKLYFNPNYTYYPPVLADGTRMPNASYTAAWIDGYHTGDGTIDLSTQYRKLGTIGTYYDDLWGSNSNRGAYFAVRKPAPYVPVSPACSNANYDVVDLNAITIALGGVGQRQNFANWFSYYRSRLLAMKSSAGEAFRAVGPEFRVGFHTIDGQSRTDDYGGFLPVDTFTGTHRQNWYTMFYRQYAAYGTPLRAATSRIGEYFRTGASPSGSAVADPIQYSCQPNYHILSTDGYWNGAGGSGPAATQSWNSSLPANRPDLLAALGSEFGQTFVAGDPWPRPYSEKPGTNSKDTLADISAYYWQTDLRSTLPNNVPTNSKDSASWQHVTMFSLAFSPAGNVPYPSGLAAIKAGTLDWPVPASDSTTAVDDLWSAAIVGHGQYFNVSSPEELLNKLGAALLDIAGRTTSGSASSGNSEDFEAGDAPYLFRASYTPGEWTGQIEARALDRSTGQVGATPLWDAKSKLDTLVAGAGWDTSRRIATVNSSTGTAVPFRYVNLSAAQKLSLDVNATYALNLVNYLRGDRSNEDDGATFKTFRQRRAILADIVNSKPTYVAAPSMPYLDSFNPGYSAYKAAKATRTPMVYVGANDGMLHAFQADVGNTGSGEEKWAFVPSEMFRDGVDGLAGYAWKFTDPLPKRYSHRYRVDQTPNAADVDFGRTGGTISTANWRTLLVAGLNKGGKGYYALDVTSPDAASEAQVASKFLWEFKGEIASDPRMGYSFGDPMIVKTRAFGWVVLVTSGYNNVAGTGHLWVLNAKTGAVLHRFDTGVGTAAIPSGLAEVNAFRQSELDDTVEQLYGTDLLGNVWRFDVSDPVAANWTGGGVKLASVGAPITTRAVPNINPFNPSERWVMFGTGKLLAQSDVSSANTNSTFFAVKDGSGATPLIPSSPLTKSDLQVVTPTSSTPEGPSVKGWYLELGAAGFGQMNIAPEIRRGIVLFGGNQPTATVCTNGMQGTVFARRLGSGKNAFNGGSAYLSLSAGLSGVGTVKTKRTGTGHASSQAAMALKVDMNDGSTAFSKAADFKTPLYGGRSNFRYVQIR